MNTQDTIRPYGPGKFDTILDQYVYSVSLDGGCDMELSDNDGCWPWYGMMRHGHTIFRDHDPSLETLTTAEHAKLTDCAGVIIAEDSNGFVYVDYYDSETDLDKEWSAIESAYGAES